ncbi:hypothetical protein GGF42_002329 [Coemansia sp. RSA 2424]|nr:hypothetical protein GGF42_002329 [Coemansia sp. RSA 2424]
MSLAVTLYRYRLVLALMLAAGALYLLAAHSLHAGGVLDTLIGDGSLDRPRGGINRHWPEAPPPVGAAQGPAAQIVSARDGEQAVAEQKVRQLIQRNRVMVFSKTYCPYSRSAKRLLSKYKDTHGLEFVVLEADLEPDPMEVKAALGKLSGRLTFPNIFVDGQSIGGSDDLHAKHASGDLATLLQKAGLIDVGLKGGKI